MAGCWATKRQSFHCQIREWIHCLDWLFIYSFIYCLDLPLRLRAGRLWRIESRRWRNRPWWWVPLFPRRRYRHSRYKLNIEYYFNYTFITTTTKKKVWIELKWEPESVGKILPRFVSGSVVGGTFQYPNARTGRIGHFDEDVGHMEFLFSSFITEHSSSGIEEHRPCIQMIPINYAW